jgi:flavin-binding protein dodecin
MREVAVSVVEEPRTLTSVAKVIEITSESTKSFEDAINKGILKAGETVTAIKGAWVNGQQVKVEDGKVVGFRVDLKVTFVVH